MAKISIIIPVYNAELFIAKCLDSCLNQTFDDYDIIAVDDGSTDRSNTILDQYAMAHPRLHVIHQPNGGVSAARAAGVRASKSEWVTFVDADDAILSDCLEAMAAIASDKIDIVVFDTWLNLETDKSGFAQLILNNEIWSICSKLIRRELFDDYILSVPLTIKIGEDFVTQIRLLKNIRNQVIFKNLNKYLYTENQNSVTHTYSRTYQSEKELIEAVGEGLSHTKIDKGMRTAFINWRISFLKRLIGYQYDIQFNDDWIYKLVQDSNHQPLSLSQIFVIKSIKFPIFRITLILGRKIRTHARNLKLSIFHAIKES